MKIKSVTFNDNMEVFGDYQKRLIDGDKYGLELLGGEHPYAIEVTNKHKQKVVCVAFPAVKQWEPDDCKPLPAKEEKPKQTRRRGPAKASLAVPSERANP